MAKPLEHPLPSEIFDRQSALLWQQFKADDAAAFGQIADRYYRLLYNYGAQFSADPEFIRDCIQEMMLELWERRARLSDVSSVKAYLLKSLRHRIGREHIRLQRLNTVEELAFGNSESVERPVESIIIETEQERVQIRQLQQLIAELTLRQQEIIYLRFYQQLDYKDIAEIMGLSHQSVANLLHRTLRNLRERWPASFLLLLQLLAAWSGL
jgi:RNA polymerase sigma factor (sigma-70 family)